MSGTIPKASKRPAKVSHNYDSVSVNASAVMEDGFEYKASCPICGKRVFDLSGLPATPVRVRLKCPHCRKIVRIPFAGASP
jgi:hypothetical protein